MDRTSISCSSADRGVLRVSSHSFARSFSLETNVSFFVEDKGGSFEATPTGVHLARCYRIIDMGTQTTEYMGEPKIQRKVMLGWEVFVTGDDGKLQRMKDGRLFAMFKKYTLSWSEKANLRNDLQAWRGKPFSTEEMRRFDLKNVLGAWCMLNVIERPGKDGRNYVNIDGITPVPGVVKQAGMPKGENELELFNLSEPDMKIFNTFSQSLKDKIMASPEWKAYEDNENHGAEVNHAAASHDDEDIPF